MPKVEKIPEHPAGILARLNALRGEPFHYEFSKYIYIPQSTKDDREYIRMPSEEAEGGYARLVEALSPVQELALHSRIFRQGEELHIPMLDLAEPFSETHLSALRNLMREFGVPEFAAYHSGRSAHVYGMGFLNSGRMRQFLARALLLNLPGAPPLVDSRWVGHRIYAGYGSLRWSCNTKQYLSPPKAIGLFSAG